LEEEASNAEEQLASNTISAVHNSLKDGKNHPFLYKLLEQLYG